MSNESSLPLSELQKAKNSEDEALVNLNDYILEHQNELPSKLVYLYKNYLNKVDSTSSMLLSIAKEERLKMERDEKRVEKRYSQKFDELNQEVEQKIKNLQSGL